MRWVKDRRIPWWRAPDEGACDQQDHNKLQDLNDDQTVDFFLILKETIPNESSFFHQRIFLKRSLFSAELKRRRWMRTGTLAWGSDITCMAWTWDLYGWALFLFFIHLFLVASYPATFVCPSVRLSFHLWWNSLPQHSTKHLSLLAPFPRDLVSEKVLRKSPTDFTLTLLLRDQQLFSEPIAKKMSGPVGKSVWIADMQIWAQVEPFL